MRRIPASFIAGVALVGGVAALLNWRSWEVRRLQDEVHSLEREREQLVEYARGLVASRRVAQVDILEPTREPSGREMTNLLWQEIDSNGLLGAPLPLQVVGEQVYFEAAVLKFNQPDPGSSRGEPVVSLVLFRRVFGDGQPAGLSNSLNSESHRTLPSENWDRDAQDGLWSRFGELMEDPSLAEQYHVRVAQFEAPSVRVKPGQIWEVTLDAVGGLNLRLIGQRVPPLRAGATLATRPIRPSS